MTFSPSMKPFMSALLYLYQANGASSSKMIKVVCDWFWFCCKSSRFSGLCNTFWPERFFSHKKKALGIPMSQFLKLTEEILFVKEGLEIMAIAQPVQQQKAETTLTMADKLFNVYLTR